MVKNSLKHLPWLIGCLLCVMNLSCLGQQKTISITIDDIPNTSKFQKDGGRAVLLDRLDSLGIPFTVFINENKVFQTDLLKQNKKLLSRWISHDQSTVGNHSFSHPRYSLVGFDTFVEDVLKGLHLSDSIASLHGKTIHFFRFPFNDLGKDSIQHNQIKEFLNDLGDQIAPFTVESSDWMFDSVYQYYLKSGEVEKAKAIGELYVKKTMEIMSFFDQMGKEIYGRSISQIYLCHDNDINADYLSKIIDSLTQEGYSIVGFEESLKDPIYAQKDNYYQKWGVSWLYRWMESQPERVRWMQREPGLSEIQELYEQITRNR